jgi:N-acyl-D-amino-acid deacylase
VLRGGTVVDGTGGDPVRADLLIRGGRVGAVGDLSHEPADRVLDCTGRLVLPGFVDAHSHAEGQVFDDEVALALLRQGVTSVIGGQDGVSYAPGDGRYATDYFGAINGPHPTYAGGGVRDLLRTYAHTTPVNVGYLVPAGTVRAEVCGLGDAPATTRQLALMRELVATGMAEGALGLSSGLDYAPGLFADVAELAELCGPVAAAGGVYASHLRGGYEENSRVGVDELVAICRAAGVKGHVSHFHARSELLVALVDEARAAGVDLTFDSYPYSRGCTILAMLALPPDLMGRGLAAVRSELSDPEARDALADRVRRQLAGRADLGARWADQVRFAHVPAPAYDGLHGRSLAEGAAELGVDPARLAVDVLAATDLHTTVIMATPHERSDAEMAAHLTHPAHVGGSDGIFLGRAAHPRAWGTFARYLADFGRDRGELSVAEVAHAFAHRPARRFQLGTRGSLTPGSVADVVVVDWAAVAGVATYAVPRRPAEGIADVFVNGVPVLADGRLTGARSGIGLHRKPARARPLA